MNISYKQQKKEAETTVNTEIVPGQTVETDGGYIMPFLVPAVDGTPMLFCGVKVVFGVDSETSNLRASVSSVRYDDTGAIKEEIPLNADVIPLQSNALTNDDILTLAIKPALPKKQ